MIWNLAFVLLSLHPVTCDLLGKFVFQDEPSLRGNSLDILHKPEGMLFAPSPGPIASNEIASVFALSLGLSIPKDIKWTGLQVTNPFKMPKALTMFSIDNLPKDHKLNLASTARYLIEDVDGSDSISDMLYVAPKYSLPSHLSAIMEDKSKIVTISGDDVTAESWHSSGALSETSLWSEKTQTWKSVSGDGKVKTTLAQKDILDKLNSILISGFVYDSDKKTVKVHVKDLEFSFNLDDKVDFLLFSELVYILSQYDEISKGGKSLIRDDAPDLYLFSISALKGIESKYGSNSPQMLGALLLIENIVHKVTNGFVKLYDGNVLAVCLSQITKEDVYVEHKDEIQPVIQHILDNHNNKAGKVVNLNTIGSEVHVMDKMEAEASRKLCEAVQGSLFQSSKSIKFKCAQDLPTYTLHKRSLLQYDVGVQNGESLNGEDLNLASAYDEMFPVIFNMWFWTLVLLALIVYAVSIAMWNMDPGRDSIIYRLTQQKIKSE